MSHSEGYVGRSLTSTAGDQCGPPGLSQPVSLGVRYPWTPSFQNIACHTNNLNYICRQPSWQRLSETEWFLELIPGHPRATTSRIESQIR